MARFIGGIMREPELLRRNTNRPNTVHENGLYSEIAGARPARGKDTPMLRIRLCLTITALAVAITAPGLARETKMSSPDGGGCTESPAPAQAKTTPAPKASRTANPERETKIKPSVHGDAPPSGRMPSRRWHSFLPGMVR
ncbi:hypothetical protein [Marilutibacter chinensis]|uniref:Uncharacterized protein n=1 Tax=Marilutibacter chinensis TaxID=2912247 RepID=A0ABS9HR28_9GAMM|nr:hypothetical protein [Lysobacter chinensis]MCF7221395.1 hypothetical protein [Lysobacter chinensis]